MLDKVHKLVDSAFSTPVLLNWRKSRFSQAFDAGDYGGVCRGVYATAAEAAAHAPKSLPLGYDNEGAASMYRDRLDRVYPSDYAMMLWLGKFWEEGARSVFDLGGHVGIGYYAYQKHLRYPEGLSWRVCDVPAVVESGLALAAERDLAKRLTFTSQPADADGVDLLFTSGCLQYLEETLAERIAALRVRPKWLLVNLLPLHEKHAFWTVQNIGRAFCPYRIQHAATFFNELDKLGYALIDKWENLEKSCEVAFEPDYSLDRYYGAALRLR
jgi:putative methyltransferase (TIGR04325 family)